MNSAEKARKLVEKAKKNAKIREAEVEKANEKKQQDQDKWANDIAKELLEPALKKILNNAKTFIPATYWSLDRYIQEPLAIIDVMSHISDDDEKKWGSVTSKLRKLIEAEGFNTEVSYDNGEPRSYDDYDIGASFSIHVYLPNEK